LWRGLGVQRAPPRLDDRDDEVRIGAVGRFGPGIGGSDGVVGDVLLSHVDHDKATTIIVLRHEFGVLRCTTELNPVVILRPLQTPSASTFRALSAADEDA
jgi:hypothetical protein